MDPKTVLVSGGAGFVGAALAIDLRQRFPGARVVALDNLRRRGSELNLPRLRQAGVEFLHGDIRRPEDLEGVEAADLLLECSAEPSVLAGLTSSPEYVLQTNLGGTLNLLERCRRNRTAVIFLSTSRVYGIEALRAIRAEETGTRFEIAAAQEVPGVSPRGISEEFSVAGARSLYGATKLASELFIEEYAYAYGVPAIINRCGVIAGPWQMGKIDQGFVVFWLARHLFGGELNYLGFGGSGKQVRDVLHVADLCDLIALQIRRFDEVAGQVFNAGGGRAVSVSLLELTRLCQTVTGRTIEIERVRETRAADIPVYLSDCAKIQRALGWAPTRGIERLVHDTHEWMVAHRDALAAVLG